MDYRKFFDIIQAKYLIKVAFIIGFLLAGIRLENHLYETGNWKHNPVLANNELVLSEQPNEGPIFTVYDDKHVSISYDIVGTKNIDSYKFILLAYNSHIHHRLIKVISLHIFPSDIISFLQNNNIWHKSSGEEPGMLR